MKIIESPREGMQGFSRVLSTHDKVRYISQLLMTGFDTVETGSLVSPRLIPQMADSLEVLEQLIPLKNLAAGPRKTNIMFLSVNTKGAEKLAAIDTITHISYPFSFSPAFLRHNVNASVEESFETAQRVIDLCMQNNKTPVIYISMAFGNPYGDPWSLDLLEEWVDKLFRAGARIIPLSNVAIEIDATLITEVYSMLIRKFSDIEFGLHLHTANRGWFEKVEAAWESGCRRFDGVINGWGGCPMAGREMLGNLQTENLLEFARRNGVSTGIDNDSLLEAYRIAGEIFTPEP